MERLQAKVGGRQLGRVWADDRVAVQALAIGLVVVGHETRP